jgi:hypothetical protein
MYYWVYILAGAAVAFAPPSNFDEIHLWDPIWFFYLSKNEFGHVFYSPSIINIQHFYRQLLADNIMPVDSNDSIYFHANKRGTHYDAIDDFSLPSCRFIFCRRRFIVYTNSTGHVKKPHPCLRAVHNSRGSEYNKKKEVRDPYFPFFLLLRWCRGLAESAGVVAVLERCAVAAEWALRFVGPQLPYFPTVGPGRASREALFDLRVPLYTYHQLPLFPSPLPHHNNNKPFSRRDFIH